jgi:hypothetical protein
VLVRPVGVTRWLPARVAWQDADADCALIAVEDGAGGAGRGVGAALGGAGRQ